MSAMPNASVSYVIPQTVSFRAAPANALQVQRESGAAPVVPRALLPLLLLFTRPQTVASALAAAPAAWELEPDDLTRLVETWVTGGVLAVVKPADQREHPTRLEMFRNAVAQHNAAPGFPFPLKSLFTLQAPPVYYPGLDTREIHDRRRFSWVPALEAAFPAIRQELLALLERIQLTPVYQRHTTAGEWAAAYFWVFGKENREITAACPETAAALQQIPGATAFGTSLFSALAPGTFVSPHYGYSNAKLRCQLPLVIPPDCRLKVGEIEIEQQEGRCIIFDDSFLHSAWNPSEHMRYVLVFDFYHPDLDESEIAYLSELAAEKNLANQYLPQPSEARVPRAASRRSEPSEPRAAARRHGEPIS